MRINPISFNYGLLVEDMKGTSVQVLRTNVVLENDIFTMWGENIDQENQIMALKSISVKREHTKNSKETITDLWESTLNQYAIDEQPEEIMAKIQDKANKAAEAAKKAEERAKKENEEKVKNSNNTSQVS